MLVEGLTVTWACKRLEIAARPCSWRTKYGVVDPQMAKRLKELERENTSLKQLLAETHLDKRLLQEIA